MKKCNVFSTVHWFENVIYSAPFRFQSLKVIVVKIGNKGNDNLCYITQETLHTNKTIDYLK